MEVVLLLPAGRVLLRKGEGSDFSRQKFQQERP
jgi:hypothetical protein